MDDLRYPIGKFTYTAPPVATERELLIQQIERVPSELRTAVAGFSSEQFDTPYREGGWTVRQVVHHVPDSHMNAYIRFKLALTEEEPTIKPYQEARWAELADTRSYPVESSLATLELLHQRWVLLMRGMQEADWQRTFRHPDLGVISLGRNLGLYAWHGNHHVAHVTRLRERMGW